MTTIVLWLNVLAFASLASSVGLTLVIRSRRSRAWIDWYLLYAGSYATWALVFSVQFFVLAYEPGAAEAVLAVGAWVRAVVSAAVALALPMLVATLADKTAVGRALRWCAALFGAAIMIVSVTLRFTGGFAAAVAVNILFNACLAGIAAIGLPVARRSSSAAARSILPPVLIVSVSFYGAAAAGGAVIAALGARVPLLSAIAVSVYCLPWALVSLGRQGAWLSGQSRERGLPSAFVADHELTPREADVAARVANGDSNAEIAGLEFVSIKTVETHLSSIYRKTGARNRVELVNLITRYAGGE